MQSNAIFYFYCSLYLLISGALIEFNLLDPSRCSVVTFTGCASIWEALQRMKYRIEQNYDIVPFEI